MLAATALASTLAGMPALAGAQTVRYQCEQGRQVSVTYRFGEATAWATVRLDGQMRRLRYGAGSDAENTVFSAGPYRLSMPNDRNLRRAQPVFITKATRTVVNGRVMPADLILYKACRPVGMLRRA